MVRQLEKLNEPRGARMTERSPGQSGVCVRKERSARKRDGWIDTRMEGWRDGLKEGWMDAREKSPSPEKRRTRKTSS